MLMRLQHADYGLPKSQAQTQLPTKHLAALDGPHLRARLDGAASKEWGSCGILPLDTREWGEEH